MDEKWPEEGLPALWGTAGHDVKTPPHDDLTEVVWMTGVSPESLGHYLSFVLWLVLEDNVLVVTHSLKQEADDPDTSSNLLVSSDLLVKGWVTKSVQDWGIVDHCKETLHAKDEHERVEHATDVATVWPSFRDVGVSGVLNASELSMAQEDMAWESEHPDADHAEDQPHDWVDLILLSVEDNACLHDVEGSPADVNEAKIVG